MDYKDFDKIRDLAKVINEIEKRNLEECTELVNEIIEYKYEDEDTISRVFDKILSIAFAAEEDIKEIYYKLLNYTKKINKQLSIDYEEIFIDNFKIIDDEDIDNII